MQGIFEIIAEQICTKIVIKKKLHNLFSKVSRFKCCTLYVEFFRSI